MVVPSTSASPFSRADGIRQRERRDVILIPSDRCDGTVAELPATADMRLGDDADVDAF